MKERENRVKNIEIPLWIFRLGMVGVMIALYVSILDARATAAENERDTGLRAMEEAALAEMDQYLTEAEETLGLPFLLSTYRVVYEDDGSEYISANGAMGLMVETKKVGSNGYNFGVLLVSEHTFNSIEDVREQGYQFGDVTNVVINTTYPRAFQNLWMINGENETNVGYRLDYWGEREVKNEDGVAVAKRLLVGWKEPSSEIVAPSEREIISYPGTIGGPCTTNTESVWAFWGVPSASVYNNTPILRIIHAPFKVNWVKGEKYLPARGADVIGLANGGDSGAAVKDLLTGDVCGMVVTQMPLEANRFSIVFLPSQGLMEEQIEEMLTEAEELYDGR